MGLDVLMAREDRLLLPRSACRYQRLRGDGGGEAASPSLAAGTVRVRRPLRLRRRACTAAAAAGRWKATAGGGGGGGKRLLRLRLLRLVFLVPARRVAALLAELARRLAVAASAVDADCPAIVFSSQWGLPVLSHSASTSGRSAARLRALYLERSLSARSSTSSGAGSPC